MGKGEGIGFNINICWNLPSKSKDETYDRNETCGDEEYIECFKKIILPILSQFEPDIIMVSCGFDSGDGDHIGNLKISKSGYIYMTQMLMQLKKKIFFILEGGYNL